MANDAESDGSITIELNLLRQQLREANQQIANLRDQLAMYPHILDAITEMVLVKGPHSRIIYANKAFREYYGMTMDELRQMIDAPFNEPDYTQQYVKDDTFVFTTGQTLDIPQEPVTRHDGTVRLFHTVKSAIRDARQVVQTVGVSRDITDRIRAEEQLRRERADTAQLIAGAPTLIVGISTDGITTFVNPAVENLTGYQAAELVGRNWWSLMYPGESYRQVEALLRAFTGGEVHDHEMVLTTRTGAPRRIAWAYLNRLDDNRNAAEVIGFGTDLTERTHGEEERARLQDEIIRMQEATLRELSTPLIPITDEVVAMPLIGALDSRRAQQILDTLLHGIGQTQARIAILDITGVPVVDTQVANTIVQAARAVWLLGAQVVLTGIRPEVAQTLVGMGVDLSGIVTRSTLQSGIAYAIRS